MEIVPVVVMMLIYYSEEFMPYDVIMVIEMFTKETCTLYSRMMR
jgi:hypothetical protein